MGLLKFTKEPKSVLSWRGPYDLRLDRWMKDRGRIRLVDVGLNHTSAFKSVRLTVSCSSTARRRSRWEIRLMCIGRPRCLLQRETGNQLEWRVPDILVPSWECKSCYLLNMPHMQLIAPLRRAACNLVARLTLMIISFPTHQTDLWVSVSTSNLLVETGAKHTA